MPEIYSIVYKPIDPANDRADGYIRVATQQATLRAGYGIEGDRKGGHPKRQLNVMSYESLQNLRQAGFAVEPGQMGEQIVISGLTEAELLPGAHVRLGETAQIEVIELRTGCDRFEHFQGLSRSLAAGRMGVMARVIADGVIHVGDGVEVMRESNA
jgi:MOSC domain-containing protein YiiM